MNNISTGIMLSAVVGWGCLLKWSLPRWRGTAQAMVTWGLVSSFYCFQFFLRSTPNAIGGALMHEFGININDLGQLSAAYYIPYVWLQIPLGVLLDRWGPKVVLRWGTLVCVTGAAIFSLSPGFAWAFAGRVLIGAGGAASLIGSIRMNSLWFSASSLAFATGLLSGLGKIGGSSANGILPLALKHGGSWRPPLQTIALLGGVLCLSIWAGARNGPQDTWQHQSEVGVLRSVWNTLCRPMTWFLGLYGCALYATLTVFSDTYSIPFLMQKMGYTLPQAGQAAAWVGIGSALGSAVATGGSDMLKRRLIFVRGCALGTLVLATMVIWFPFASTTLMNGAMFGLGLCSGGQILALTLVCDTTARANLGVSIGVMNAFLMSGGMLFNPLVGKVLQRQWSGARINGVPFYTLLNYQKALSFLIGLFALAWVVSWWIRETHPKHPATCPLV